MKFAVAFALFALLAAVSTISAEEGYPWTGVPSSVLAIESNLMPITVGGLTPAHTYTIGTTSAICRFQDGSNWRQYVTFTTAAAQTTKAATLRCITVSSATVAKAALTLEDGSLGQIVAQTDDFPVFLPSFKTIRPLDANLCSLATAIGVTGLVNITMPLSSPNGCTFYESCTLEDLYNGDLVPITEIKPSGATISLYAICDTNWAQTISIDGVSSQQFIVYPPPTFENFPTTIRGGDSYVTNDFQIHGMIPTESYILEPMFGNCTVWDDRIGQYTHSLLMVNPDTQNWDVVFSCDGVEARTNFKLTRLVTGSYWYTPFFTVYFDQITSTIPTQYTDVCSGKLHANGHLGDVMRYTSDDDNCAVYLDSACETDPISDIFDNSAYKLLGTDGLDFWIKCKYYSSGQLLYLSSVPSNYYLVLTQAKIEVPDPVRGGDPNPLIYVSRLAMDVSYTLSTPNANCLFWDGSAYHPTASLFFKWSGSGIKEVVDPLSLYILCTASNPAQTITLSSPDADTISAPFRVYVPKISHIKERFYSDECQVVTVSDLVEGTFTLADMYVKEAGDVCTFYDDSGTCDTDPDDGAAVAQGGSLWTGGDDYVLSMLCEPGIHRQIMSDPADITAGAQSNPFIVLQRGANKGSICGDPYFHGLDGRGFTFNGKADHWYNVYSNPWVTINSKFISARTTKEATVNGAVGLATSHYNISVDNVDLDMDTETLIYYINGHKFHIYPGQSLQLGSGCLSISFERVVHTKIHHSLVIKTKQFTIHTYFLADHNAHVNTTYLDYFVAADQSHPSTLGGVLGFTASGDYNISYFLHHDKHFVASGPFAHDSHADSYKGDKLCHLVHARAMEEAEEEEQQQEEEEGVKEEKKDVEASFVAAHHKKSNAPCQYLPDNTDCKNSIMCASHFCHPTLKICLTPGPCFKDDDCTAEYPSCNNVGDDLPFYYTGCADGGGNLLSDDSDAVTTLLEDAAAWDQAHHSTGHKQATTTRHAPITPQ